MKLVHGFIVLVPIFLLFIGFQLYSVSVKRRFEPVTNHSKIKQNRYKDVVGPGGVKLPYYFKRFLHSNELRHLLMAYSRFHKSKVKQMLKNTDNVCSYNTKSLNKGLLIFKQDSCGLGNNLQGLISTFLVAMLSGRVFLVSWPGYGAIDATLETLFKDPNIHFKWNYKDFYVRNSEYRKKNCLFDPVQKNPAIQPSFVDEHIDMGYTYFSTAKHKIRPFMCNNIRLHLASIGDRIAMRSNQYFVQVLMLSKTYQPVISQMFRNNNVYGPLARFLLRPSTLILEKVDKILLDNDIQVPKIYHEDVFTRAEVKKHANSKTKMYGLQMRRDDRERILLQVTWPADYHEPYFYSCMEDIILKNRLSTPYRVFVVSDNSTVKAIAKSYYGDKYIGINAKLKLIDRDEDDAISAVVDSILLSYCHDFVVTHMSTFGAIGYARASIEPRVVALRGKEADCLTAKRYSGHELLHLADPPCHYIYELGKFDKYEMASTEYCNLELN